MIAVRTFLAVAAAASGACVGSLVATGCSLGDDCKCHAPMSIREGTFSVTRVQSSTMPEAVSGLEGATLTVEPDAVTVEYDRRNGHVRATYQVVTKYPL